MMRWASFLKASGGKLRHGRRNRVGAIDTAVQAYEANAAGWTKLDRLNALVALRGLCADYLADPEGKAQTRLDGVQQLSDAIRADIDDLEADEELLADRFLRYCQEGRVAELGELLARDDRTNWHDANLDTGLHIAARFGKLPVLQRLIDDGADVTAANADGNTPLHVAAGIGSVPGIAALREAPANNIEAVNSEGFTPLAYAARMSRAASVEALLAAHAEMDTPALFGFTALDFARSFASVQSETLLMRCHAHGRSLDTIEIPPIARARAMSITRLTRTASTERLDTVQELGDQLHTVDVLLLATTEDPANRSGGPHARDLAAAYWTLYQVPELRPILGAVALAAIGARAGGSGACRIFATNDESVRRIGGMGAGVLQNINNVVNWSRKPTQLSMEGTIIHELCHGASHFVFANDVMPFPRTGAPGSEVDATYLNALDTDLNTHWDEMYRRRDGSLTGGYSRYLHGDDPAIDTVDGRAYTTLFGRLQGYSGSGRIVCAPPPGSRVQAYPLGFIFEAIVGVPQCWHVFGRDQCSTWAPEMLGYFETEFLPAVEDWITNHPNAGKLDPLPVRSEPVGERKLSAPGAFRSYYAMLAE